MAYLRNIVWGFIYLFFYVTGSSRTRPSLQCAIVTRTLTARVAAHMSTSRLHHTGVRSLPVLTRNTWTVFTITLLVSPPDTCTDTVYTLTMIQAAVQNVCDQSRRLHFVLNAKNQTDRP